MRKRPYDLREVAAEIRGRLGAIALATDVLEKSASDAEEMLDIIDRNADQLINLADQLDMLRAADDRRGSSTWLDPHS